MKVTQTLLFTALLTVLPALAPQAADFWRDGQGKVVRDGQGDCLRTGHGTQADCPEKAPDEARTKRRIPTPVTRERSEAMAEKKRAEAEAADEE